MPVLGSELLSTSEEVANCSPPSSVYFFSHWSGEDPVMKGEEKPKFWPTVENTDKRRRHSEGVTQATQTDHLAPPRSQKWVITSHICG